LGRQTGVLNQDQRRGFEFERAPDDLARVDGNTINRAALLALVLDPAASSK
jgi:hypothetical protein